MTRIVIHGAAGRMGLRLVALAQEAADLSVVAAVDRPDHPHRGEDIGTIAGVGPIGVKLGNALPAGGDAADVLIDFSLPQGAGDVIASCVKAGWPLVMGTTGLTAAHQQALDAAAGSIPVLQATNFSRVVNVLHALLEKAAPLFDRDYDVEVLEAHHRFKKDAPSGTALSLAKTICAASGRDFDTDVIYTRHGDDVPRKPGEITMQTLRIGDHPGEHTVYFAAPGERLELKHVSTSRDSYARGALEAAAWLAKKSPGRYMMRDVLGL